MRRLMILTVFAFTVSACAPASDADRGVAERGGTTAGVPDRTDGEDASSRPTDAAEDAVPVALDIAPLEAGLGIELAGAVGPGNVLVSPMSVYRALALVGGGAGEGLRGPFTAVLGVDPADRGFHRAVARVTASRSNAAGENELRGVSRLWVERGTRVTRGYLDLLAVYPGADHATARFREDPEGARTIINDWTGDATGGLIPDLLPEGSIDARTRAVLTDALYFKAAWKEPFDPDRTRPVPFRLADGSSVDVPTMTATVGCRTATMDGTTVLELPYRGDAFSLVVACPDEPAILADPTAGWAFLRDGVAALAPRRAPVFLPRFELDFGASLRTALTDLGLGDAFVPGRADFSALTPGDLFLSDVVHRAVMLVDEVGTEAAAATGAVFSVTEAVPVEPVRIDRPFLVAIHDRVNGGFVFLGRVMDPRS